MLLTSTTVNGAVSNDSNNNITMSVGNTVIANVNSSGIFFESGKKAIYTGAVLQVVQSTFSSQFSVSANGSWQAVTGFTASITPASTSNKVLVMLDLKGSNGTGAVIAAQLQRNGSAIYTGSGSGHPLASTGQYYFAGDLRNIPSMMATYLDSPSSTSSVTYSVAIYGDNGGGTIYVNQDGRNASVDTYTISSLTLMEIAG